MPRFSGEYRETFVVDGAVDVVSAHFADLATIARNYGDLERFDIHDEHEITFVLEPMSELGVTFNGRYRGRYDLGTDGVLRWKTVQSANIWVSGDARFSAAGPSRTRVEFRQHVETEMQVNAILGKLIRPVVTREINNGTRDYLERMRADLRRVAAG